MEEKKTARQVALNPADDTPKYTEAQLNSACQRVYEDMARRVQQVEMGNTIRRLEFLFKVLEFRSEFDPDFIGDCVKEIKECLAIPEEGEKGE